jgi:hypothetical protein
VQFNQIVRSLAPLCFAASRSTLFGTAFGIVLAIAAIDQMVAAEISGVTTPLLDRPPG